MTTQHIFSADHPDQIPAGIMRGLDNYRDHGLTPGDCLRAILAGRLFDAFARADPETARAMPAIVSFIVTKFHVSVWGSDAAVDAWIARGNRKRAERGE